MSDAQTREPNLLIIRRGGAAELETPKGGVWKIAYADFMTAMMAFFLVMWLINATSETTKTGVANYFNPIKLADGTHLPKKGLLDPEEGTKSEESGHEAGDAGSEHAEAEAAEADQSQHESSEKKARFSEEALFRDPYAVLAAIAAEAEGSTPLVARGGGVGSVGAGGEDRAGDIYGDPFDPAAWQVTSAPAVGQQAGAAGDTLIPTGSAARGGTDGSHQMPDAGALAGSATPALQTAAAEIPGGAGEIGGGAGETASEAGESAGGDESAGAEGEVTGGISESARQPGEFSGEAGENASKVSETVTEAAAASEPAQELPPADGAAEAAEEHVFGSAGESATGEPVAGGAEDDHESGPLRDRIAEALELGSPQAPNVSVESADGGVLISLADQVEFGMFAVGSAEPLPETIAVMEKIAALLNTIPGKVVIRGHTDARPFRSGEYDNWRLSSARAHMAYHMLVRGGLDESRVERIEGYADRALKLPDDPEAAENRRIDILVQEVNS